MAWEVATNEVWVGTDRSLIRWKDGEWAAYPTGGATTARLANAFLVDHEGSVWLSVERGLLQLRVTPVAVLGAAEGLSGDEVTSVHAARDGSTLGYGDNGFSITLSDLAAADVHTYRTTVTGNELTPIMTANPAAPLTGNSQTDGRTADLGTVLTSSPRITTLGTFAGLNPNGEWTLFLSDLSGGGLAQLESWSLEFTVVPEPESAAMLSAVVLLGGAILHRRVSNRGLRRNRRDRSCGK